MPNGTVGEHRTKALKTKRFPQLESFYVNNVDDAVVHAVMADPLVFGCDVASHKAFCETQRFVEHVNRQVDGCLSLIYIF